MQWVEYPFSASTQHLYRVLLPIASTWYPGLSHQLFKTRLVFTWQRSLWTTILLLITRYGRRHQAVKPSIRLLIYTFTLMYLIIIFKRFRFSSSTYCSKPKCRRWPVAVFSYILDTTRVNIQTLVSLNSGKDPRKINSFEFGHKLAMALITPHLYSRELSGVPRNILLKMHQATGDDCFLRHVMNVCEPSQSVHDELPYRGKPAFMRH